MFDNFAKTDNSEFFNGYNCNLLFYITSSDPICIPDFRRVTQVQLQFNRIILQVLGLLLCHVQFSDWVPTSVNDTSHYLCKFLFNLNTFVFWIYTVRSNTPANATPFAHYFVRIITSHFKTETKNCIQVILTEIQFELSQLTLQWRAQFIISLN